MAFIVRRGSHCPRTKQNKGAKYRKEIDHYFIRKYDTFYRDMKKQKYSLGVEVLIG